MKYKNSYSKWANSNLKRNFLILEQRDWLRKCCKLHYYPRKQKSDVKSYKENLPIPLENVDILESIGNLEEIWLR